MDIGYILRSRMHPGRLYVGITSDLDTRVAEHHRATTGHTAQFRPWDVIAVIHLPSRSRAEALEACFKSGTGRAFCARKV